MKVAVDDLRIVASKKTITEWYGEARGCYFRVENKSTESYPLWFYLVRPADASSLVNSMGEVRGDYRDDLIQRLREALVWCGEYVPIKENGKSRLKWDSQIAPLIRESEKENQAALKARDSDPITNYGHAKSEAQAWRLVASAINAFNEEP